MSDWAHTTAIEIDRSPLVITDSAGRTLLRMREDGGVDCEPPDADEAARIFVESLRYHWPEAMRQVRQEAYRQGYVAGKAIKP